MLFAALSIGFIWWVVSVISNNSPFSEYVEPGRADTVAAQFAEDGPIFMRDLAGRGNDLYVMHDGGGHNQGWTAVGVFVPDSQNCIVQFNLITQLFEAETLDESKPVENCAGRVFPVTGDGLNEYPIWSDENHLKIDVNFAERGG